MLSRGHPTLAVGVGGHERPLVNRLGRSICCRPSKPKSNPLHVRSAGHTQALLRTQWLVFRSYRAGIDPEFPGQNLTRKPPVHFPTAFTEHFPIVHHAKYVLGMEVLTNMAIVAEHAYLPKYGLEWHSEPMSIWDEWLKPYRGQALHDPELLETQKPSFYMEEEAHLAQKGMQWDELAYF